MTPSPSETDRAEMATVARLRDFIESQHFPCVGAKAALVRDTLTFRTYGTLGDADGPTSLSARLHTDLAAYIETIDPQTPVLQSFVAIFPDALASTETGFEAALWRQLGDLARIDRERNTGWSDAVSADPDDVAFSMSLAGHPFFVVGLHPGASRAARQAPYETLVFNSTLQFAQLREDGRYKRLQSVIRERELRFNGSLNPMLSDFGTRSEARQYSGRNVADDWQCPVLRHSSPP